MSKADQKEAAKDAGKKPAAGKKLKGAFDETADEEETSETEADE